ncbi:MAG TPA: hypothetical protein VJX66_13485 [Amycolatopsis sp.]|nr:hypothetical protein [Amycolatopsis sp.]
MARTHYASMGMLGLGIGYFLWYTPYSALAKAMSGGLLPMTPHPVGGLILLPAAALGTLCAMPVTLTALRWWGHARHRRVAGIKIPFPGAETAWSAFCMALIVGTTTLNFTFPGVSILLVLVLMRILTLLVGPGVDLVRRRRIHVWSMIAVGLSLASAVIALSDVANYRLTSLAVASLALYGLGYLGRFLMMSRHAKADVLDADRRYFVEEHMTTPVFLVALLGLGALIGAGSGMQALRAGFTTFLVTPAAIPAFGIGVLYEGLFIFTTLIFLDRREYSFGVPVHTCSSLLAGVAASYLLLGLYGAPPPSPATFAAAVCVVLAALALSYPAIRVRLAQRLPSSPFVLFVCGANTVRSPMAAAIAAAELRAITGLGLRDVLCAGVTVPVPGARISPDAAAALRELEIPVPRHLSREITRRMCKTASAIYCLTEAHREAVLELAPSVADRVWRLDPQGDVPEPVHGVGSSYVDCALRIRESVRVRLTELATRYPAAEGV